MTLLSTSSNHTFVVCLLLLGSGTLVGALSPFKALADRPLTILDDATFHSELGRSEAQQWMVVFCNVDRTGVRPEHSGDCRKLVPAFEKYATEKTEIMQGRLEYGEVDCGGNSKLCENLNAVPGSIVHFVGTQQVDSWTKQRQREGTLLFPWINRQVDDHEVREGTISKAAFEAATAANWDVKKVIAVQLLLVLLFGLPSATARFVSSAAWMATFVGTCFLAVATVRLLSCPLLLPKMKSANPLPPQPQRDQEEDRGVTETPMPEPHRGFSNGVTSCVL